MPTIRVSSKIRKTKLYGDLQREGDPTQDITNAQNPGQLKNKENEIHSPDQAKAKEQSNQC